jgi:hypothetical protein
MSNDDVLTLQQLTDIEAIRALKADYWWFVDNKNWKDWRELFSDDMKFFMDGNELTSTADEMVEFTSAQLDGLITAHQGHQYKIELTGPSTAKGRWILNDLLAGSDGTVNQRGYGYYLEDYEKGKDGKWRIKTLTLGYFHIGQ